MHFAPLPELTQDDRYWQQRLAYTEHCLACAESPNLQETYLELLQHYQRMAQVATGPKNVDIGYSTQQPFDPARESVVDAIERPEANAQLREVGIILQDAFPLPTDGHFANLLQAIK